jgi:hypothetical protein
MLISETVICDFFINQNTVRKAIEKLLGPEIENGGERNWFSIDCRQADETLLVPDNRASMTAIVEAVAEERTRRSIGGNIYKIMPSSPTSRKQAALAPYLCLRWWTHCGVVRAIQGVERQDRLVRVVEGILA